MLIIVRKNPIQISSIYVTVSVFKARLLTIACQEHLKVDKEGMDEIIEAAQHDVRQSIYNLQLLSSGGNGREIQSKDAAVVSFQLIAWDFETIML